MSDHSPVIRQILSTLDERMEEQRAELEVTNPNDAGRVGQLQGTIFELKNVRTMIDEQSRSWLNSEDPD